MRRVFIALALPEDIKDKLMLVRGGLEGARWQRREQLHLTLSFIGNLNTHQLEEVDSILNQIRFQPFEVEIKGLGIFGKPQRPRLLWAGVRHPKPLEDLHAKIHNALKRAGLPQDERAYMPHITLARFNGGFSMRAEGFVTEHEGLSLPPFVVDCFTLFESLMGNEGSHYELLEDYPASLF